MMPAVATSFKVTLPVADKFELSVIPPVVAVAAKVRSTPRCNAKGRIIGDRGIARCSQDYIRIRFQSIKVMAFAYTSFRFHYR